MDDATAKASEGPPHQGEAWRSLPLTSSLFQICKQLTDESVQFLPRMEALFQYWTRWRETLPEAAGDETALLSLIRCCQKCMLREEVGKLPKETTERIEKALASVADDQVVSKMPEFQRLLQLSKSPWGTDDMVQILKGEKVAVATPESSAETFDYFAMESMELCSFRLQKLWKAALYTAAFNYSTYIVINCPSSKISPTDVNFLKIFCLHMVLSVKMKSTATVPKLISSLGPSYFLSAHKMLHDDDAFSSTIKKKCTMLLLTSLITYASKGNMEEEHLKTLADILATLLERETMDDFRHLVKQFCSNCTAPATLYAVGKTMWEKRQHLVCKEVIDIYLRGLSIDINLVETLVAKKQLDNLDLVEKRLSGAYLDLSEFLSSSEIFSRECLLSAFSLQPSPKLFEMVRTRAQMLEKNASKSTTQDVSSESSGQQKLKSFDQIKEVGFEEACADLVESLGTEEARETFGGGKQQQHHNDGLLSIQGSVLTNKSSYDPLADPLTPFDLSSLGIGTETASDLVVAINSPRYHMLSWVLDWRTLEERCQNVLQNPALKYPNEELRYLVIDYTQFDEWSSDEDLDTSTGIERGYEEWEVDESSDEEENN